MTAFFRLLRSALPALSAAAAAATLATPAAAYIGPGAGLGAIVVTIALGLGVVMLLVGLVWFPLKRMMKGRKSKSGQTSRTAKADDRGPAA